MTSLKIANKYSMVCVLKKTNQENF